LHLLLAPPALPGTHANKDTYSKKDQSPPSHYQCTQPPSPAEELCESICCPEEYEHNRGDHQPHRSNQADYSQGGPESKLPSGQDQSINFGTHKMRQVCL
jgi:hypothetical protein